MSHTVSFGAKVGVVTLAVLALTVGAGAAAVTPRPAIVELYTSEGCSSCPPAEKLLETLATRADVLPLAFHVDYWNGLGWQDRFSMAEATQRQQDFARLLRLSTIGTPQLVVDGRAAIWGANPADLERALKAPRPDLALSVERNGNSLVVTVPEQPTAAKVAATPYDVYVVGYLPKATTAIRHGENAGRTITEVNVVRYIRRIGMSHDATRSWSVPLKTIPNDAERFLVLFQAQDSGAILGAARLGQTAAPYSN